MPFNVTVTEPNNYNVGSGPTENTIRSIIDATRVRIPDKRGTVHTIAKDINIIVQTSQDKCGLSSIKKYIRIN